MYTVIRGALVGITTYFLLDSVLPSGSLTIEIRKPLLIGAMAIGVAIISR
jgi:hypothetical protein